jgi:outer membrane protein TolC
VEKFMRRSAWPIISISLVLLAARAGVADERAALTMSLRDARELARKNSYQILISRSQRAEAGGQNVEAWRAYVPELVVSERFVRSNDPVTAFGVKLRQGVFTAEDLDLNALNSPDEINNFATALEMRQPLFNPDAMFGKSAAALAAKSGEYSLRRTEESVSLEVEKAYYGLVLSQSNLSTIEDAVRSAETHQSEVEAAYGKGLVSEADLLASRVRLAEFEEQRLTAKLNIANAGDHLKYLLAIDEATEIVPTDTLEITGGDISVPDVPADTIPENRADLLALRYQSEAARKGLWSRWGEWLPRMNAFGSTEWNDADAFGTNKNNWTVGVVLEWKILDGLGRVGRGNEASARSAAARTQYSEARARSGMEVRRAYRSLLTAKERVGVATKAVAQSRESLRIVEARFQQGLEKVSELLDREAATTNAKLRLQQATYDFMVARSELDFYLSDGPASSDRSGD